MVTAAAFGVVVSPSAARAATAATYVIGVGGTPPAGHNIEYVDFFPRSNVNIHNGDVIDLREGASVSTDDFHVPALLPQGQSAGQAFALPGNAVVIPDTDDGPNSEPLENLNLLDGSFAPAGSGAPGACGDQTTPCTYTGSSILDAGAMSPGQDYFVKISMPSGFTGSVTLVDFAHPITDPSATITVVADSAAASTQSALDSAAAAQLQADTAEGLAAESAANKDSTSRNANGTTNHTVSVGASTAHTEEMEMLPSTINVSPGDTVTWNYGGTSDPHTVEFPGGVGSVSVDPFDPVGACEGANGDSVAVNNMGPPDFGCSANSTPEEGFVTQPLGNPVIHAASYRLVSAAGGVFDYGASAFYGSASSFHPRSPVVEAVPAFSQAGYYEVTKAGGVFAFGAAHFFGSAAGKTSAPVVGMATGPNNDGYVLVGSDGTFYSFGSAPQVPPLGHLKNPIVGLTIDANAPGAAAYLVSAGGGVFAVGAATYYGSMGGRHLNSPIVGVAVTADGGGYWEVAADGGVFSFGDATFYGSMGGKSLSAPITAVTATPTGNGYWLVGSDGSVYPFGDAGHFASGTGHASPIVGISTSYSVASSGILIHVPAGNPNDFPDHTSFTYSFPDAGTYSFQCGFHQMMTGQVVVK